MPSPRPRWLSRFFGKPLTLRLSHRLRLALAELENLFVLANWRPI